MIHEQIEEQKYLVPVLRTALQSLMLNIEVSDFTSTVSYRKLSTVIPWCIPWCSKLRSKITQVEGSAEVGEKLGKHRSVLARAIHSRVA